MELDEDRLLDELQLTKKLQTRQSGRTKGRVDVYYVRFDVVQLDKEFLISYSQWLHLQYDRSKTEI